jgi:hypothetical protein
MGKMTASRLTGLFLCSTAAGGIQPLLAPDDGGRAASAARAKSSFRFAALEQRMLFDAAGAASFVDVVHSADVQDVAHVNDGAHDALLAALAVSPTVEVAQVATQPEIVFIDSAVDDIDEILRDIGPGAEVHILSAATDGVSQIADVLNGRSDIAAVHIISHGRAGVLELGSSLLTSQSMAREHADELATIAASLGRDADILLYGCDFAAGATGRDAVNLLAALTGADVAASDDVTGAAALGGDWQLEVDRGQIETGSLRFDGWSHTLALSNTGNWTVSGNTATNTTAGILTTINFAPTVGGTVALNATPQTFNPTAGFFTNNADSDPSLGFTYTWDTTPDTATGVVSHV